MQRPNYKKRSGFTLVEIMIVVAVIALLAAIAVPNYLRARKRSQASTFLETLHALEAAKEQYCTEHDKPADFQASCEDLLPYAKEGSSLYAGLLKAVEEGGSRETTFWDAKFYQLIDYQINDPVTPPSIVAVNCSYSDVCDDQFWGGYKYSER